LIIELINGTRFDIADYNLKRLYHYIPSANIEHNSAEVDGRSDIILNSKINSRVITVDFVYISQDIFDFYLLREEINNLFLREEAFYITFKNEPHKRWLVKVANQYNLQPNQRLETFTVEFLTMNAYAESVATTTTLKEWDIDSWAWNGTIDWDDVPVYSYFTDNFIIKNLGNTTVNPRESFLEISISANADRFIQLNNATTGEVFRYNGTLTTNDRFVINGIRTTKNDVSVFGDTNKRLLRLVPGDNRILISGASLAITTFNFRYLYK